MSSRRLRTTALMAVLTGGLWVCSIPVTPGFADPPKTIVDEWSAVQVPSPPALKPVTVDPATTAFLILDILKQNCGVRPRCIASVPRIAALLARATGKMLVVYSLIPGSSLDDVLSPLRPFPGQPSVQAGPDKFLGTDLDAILKAGNIKTVIVSGTASNGAVLYTASGAALRGYQVVVPVDLSSSATLYAEQATVWQLTQAPTISTRTTLTRSDLIKF